MNAQRKTIKPYILAVLMTFTLILTFPIHVKGAIDQTIHSIDVSVSLSDDGSAMIHEKWDMTVNEGTEIYKTLQLPDGEQLENYTVKMDGKPLTYVPDWDIEGDFKDKAGTYGRNTTDDELNWGITAYGHHTYDISYQISPFVMQTTTNEQMIFWQFINEELAVPPEHFTIHITRSNQSMRSEDGYRVWGFGFEGKTSFVDGAIRAETTESMRDDGKGVLLIKIPSGTFTNPLMMDRSFDEYAQGAFEGSSYRMEDYEEGKTVSDGGEMRKSKQEERTDKIMLGIFGVVGGVAGIGAVVFIRESYKQHKALKKYYPTLKEASKDMSGMYYRDLPVPDVYDGFAFLQDLSVEDLESNYFSTGILLLAKDDYLTVMRGNKDKPVLALNRDKQSPPGPVYELWTFLKDAADEYQSKNAGDYITKKQLKKFSKKHWRALKDYLEEIKRTSNAYVREENLRASRKKVKDDASPDLALANMKISTPLNAQGLKVRDCWVQFYNYLKDFSLLNEREINEVKLWDQLLIYAAALGIAEEVQKEFESINPQLIEESVFVGSGRSFDFVDYYIWSNIINDTYTVQATESISQAASGGFGGGTSFGGGGGSFGGGAGGGAR